MKTLKLGWRNCFEKWIKNKKEKIAGIPFLRKNSLFYESIDNP